MRLLREPLWRAEAFAPSAQAPAAAQGGTEPSSARSVQVAALPQARLLVHAPPANRPSPARLAWRRLRAGCLGGRAGAGGSPLSVEVHDLSGQRVGAFTNVGALTELVLPAGTYIVTSRRQGLRRGYTLTLQAGTSFELHLEAPLP